MQEPQDCRDRAERCVAIDRIDADLGACLARSTRYIDRAAAIKAAAGRPALIPARVAEVVRAMRRLAASRGLPADPAERPWRLLIDWSLARETRLLMPATRKEIR